MRIADLIWDWLPVLVAIGAVAVWALRVKLRRRPPARRQVREPRLSVLTTTAELEEAVAEWLEVEPGEVCVVENRRTHEVWVYVTADALVNQSQVAQVEAWLQRRIPAPVKLRLMALSTALI